MRTTLLVMVIGAAVFAGVLLLLDRPRGDPFPVGQPTQAARRPALTQRDRGEGAVEVEVTLVLPGSADGEKYDAQTQTVFLVSMNTHSVDLSAYDLTQVTELLVAGRTYAPTRWMGTSDASHHRAGVLFFPQVDRGAVLEVRIKTVAGVPVRTFRWTP